MGASVALTAAGRPAVSSRTLALLDTIEHSETRWPKALLTVDLYGQTLLALARSTKYSNLVNTLASRDPDTLVDGPFSAVDPTQLIRAGLENDLASQLKLGNEVFTDALHVRHRSARTASQPSPLTASRRSWSPKTTSSRSLATDQQRCNGLTRFRHRFTLQGPLLRACKPTRAWRHI
jgi:hypothetical protein